MGSVGDKGKWERLGALVPCTGVGAFPKPKIGCLPLAERSALLHARSPFLKLCARALDCYRSSGRRNCSTRTFRVSTPDLGFLMDSMQAARAEATEAGAAILMSMSLQCSAEAAEAAAAMA